jgi:hypothetical protein
LQQLRQAFGALVAAELGIGAPSRKLLAWDTLTWEAFGAELKKAGVALSLAQRAEWLPLFQERTAAAQALAAQIAATDAALDARIFRLYGLTEAEERLVRGA